MTETDNATPLRILTSDDPFVRQRANALAKTLDATIVGTIAPGDPTNVDADLVVVAGHDTTYSADPTMVHAAVLPRHDPREALVTRTGAALADVARAKTDTLLVVSQSTRVQLAQRAKDSTILAVTNSDTALAAVTHGEAAGLIAPIPWLKAHSSAAPGLVVRPLEHGELLHPVGSGIISIYCRRDDARARKAVATLDDEDTRAALTAERELHYHIAGDGDHHDLFVAGHAEMRLTATGDKRLVLLGLLITADGFGPYRASHEVGSADATVLGRAMAATLLAQYQTARDRVTGHKHHAAATGP
jgi:hydroxymethylbilane synthase